jgi:hypothetical protein
MRTASLFLVIVLISIVVSSCGTEPMPEQACYEFKNAFWDMCERCDIIQECRQGSRNFDCEDVFSVRDTDQLYSECIPFLEEVDCDIFSFGNSTLNSSCVHQFYTVPN